MSRPFFAVVLFLVSPLFATPGVKSPVTLQTLGTQSFDGPCPHEFHFQGTITSRGAGDVQFTWDRSDGATAPIETIHFSGPNQAHNVRTSWRLSASYHGWQQIKVTAPNFIRSNKSGFSLHCR